jgi:hypothetical protein
MTFLVTVVWEELQYLKQSSQKACKEYSMKGWVTWAVAGGTTIYAVGGYLLNLHTSDEMVRLLLYAGGLIGFGRKLDRIAE